MKRPPQLILTAAERIRSRRLWQERIPPGGTIWEVPGMKRSLISLVKQGYVLADIGSMFGVSRERVRQWLKVIGIKRREIVLGDCRVWDWSRKQFIPVAAKMRDRHQTRPCACGCGAPAKATYILGHSNFGNKLSELTRAKISEANKKRWTEYSPEDRKRVGRKISKSWTNLSPQEYELRRDVMRWGALNRKEKSQ